METLSPEKSVSSNRKRKIIKELVQGHKAATKLKLLLQNPFGAEGSLSAEELIANVLRSFTDSLSVLNTNSSSEQGCGQDGKNLMNSGENGSPAAANSHNDPRPEDSGECGKRSLTATKNGGRGCYERRRNAPTRTKVSSTADDNHAWRKYGQKEILNSKFPRSYFRCTRKYDQGCRATKQVQRTQEDPDMYLTTYIGIHTCKATSKAPYLAMDSSISESFLVNSHHDSKVPNEQDHPISSLIPSIKQEHCKEDTPSDVTDHDLDPTLWSDLKDIEPSKSSILDMDFGVDSIHFGTNEFHFDESHKFL